MPDRFENRFQLPSIELFCFRLKTDIGSSISRVAMEGLERCYRLWSRVWLPTLAELDGIASLPSDGFGRQDFCSLIEVDGAPAGLCCFRRVDLQRAWEREDSWFAPWPDDLLLRFSKTHRYALVPSWLTVAPAFRKTAGYQGPSIAGMLSELISLHVLESGAAIGFGTPRKDRSMDHWIQRAGGVCVMPDVTHHGVLVDLVAFYPEKLRNLDFSSEVLNLWSRRTDFRSDESSNEDRVGDRVIYRDSKQQEKLTYGNHDRTI